ncbi:MAG: dinitrogenase iron-molybdenum cofactor biosynthesis domain-containing protein [Deltaproteobacteria bacterium]|jgi:predicted Fe-Mo cluster-binding NifX family protein|nr:dinitrogenase iron-molybdenum cofactor biosynthesis domain-containing protein [Deltaproteobacteria bacterium]MBT4268211.1 dinitrogenase iron-molybdenum cofactor biosynthesis domain-containing protein [Deltaproteobacteria bacterium]MBT4640160.1 dinitrogenase iron-molybdenum cofactor biosynthesis domain-containing protein [Deltaproteobacteria bacterium]MBT6500695.1 dinitrogenase iron-molybdenum cofactor biosynthesis domain-containing protein [Deltaproteobacteria bacterium]MBT7151791.1 dinitrog
MKTALTVWENRISPVFDLADTLLIAEIINNKIVSKRSESFNAQKPQLLLEMLLQQNVAVLICGAISEHPATIIETECIALIPFISGLTDEILGVLADGDSITPRFLMPGCRCGVCQYKKNRNNEEFGRCAYHPGIFSGK